MGGFCLALKQARAKTLWANDADEFACATVKENFPKLRVIDRPVEGLHVEESRLEAPDILTAGFPCQSFSAAGARQGFGDKRGGLFYEIARLVREFGSRRPAILLMENVPNLLYGEKGAWIEEIVREVQRLGYWFSESNCSVLNTVRTTAIPQNRDRLFMVALSTDLFPMNKFEYPVQEEDPDPLDQYVDKSRQGPKEDYLPESNRYFKRLSEEARGATPDTVLQWRKYYPRKYVGVCPTLTANMGGGGHNVPFVQDDWGIRRLTVEECMRLQGFDPGEYRFPDSVPRHRRYSQLGNTITVPIGLLLAKQCVALIKAARKAQNEQRQGEVKEEGSIKGEASR